MTALNTTDLKFTISLYILQLTTSCLVQKPCSDCVTMKVTLYLLKILFLLQNKMEQFLKLVSLFLNLSVKLCQKSNLKIINKIDINLSVIQCIQEDLYKQLIEIKNRYNIPSRYLDLEGL